MNRRGFLKVFSALPIVGAVVARSVRDQPAVVPDLNEENVERLCQQLADSQTLASSPRFTFSNDSDTGLYRVDADTIGLAIGGKRVL